MRLVAILPVVLGISLSGCEQSDTRTVSPGRVERTLNLHGASLRLLPEWDSVSAVVVGVSQAFDSAAFEAVSGAGALGLLDERLEFYRSIVRESPEVELIMFVDRTEHVSAATLALGGPNQVSVIAQPAWVWMRDFAPLTASLENGERTLVAYTPFMRGVSQTIAAYVELPLVVGAGEIAPSIEGGNILIDGKGRCYVSVYAVRGVPERESADLVTDLGDICADVRTVPKMSYERTGHIDIFARLLNDSTVLVAEYADEEFYLPAEPVETLARCTGEQVKRAAWQDCAPIQVEYPDMARLQLGLEDPGRERPMTLRRDEVTGALAALYPEEEIEVQTRRHTLGRHEHLDAVADAFVGYGLRVMRIENPTPYLSLERIDYRDPAGRSVRKTMRLQVIFPTYTNSLMVNGVVYVPQYATASTAQNAGAVARYQSAGFKVVPTDMTQSIALRGATRCLTKEIHGN